MFLKIAGLMEMPSIIYYQEVFQLHGFYITQRFTSTWVFNTINRLINCMTRLIHGPTRLINGWWPAQSPRAAAVVGGWVGRAAAATEPW